MSPFGAVYGADSREREALPLPLLQAPGAHELRGEAPGEAVAQLRVLSGHRVRQGAHGSAAPERHAVAFSHGFGARRGGEVMGGRRFWSVSPQFLGHEGFEGLVARTPRMKVKEWVATELQQMELDKLEEMQARMDSTSSEQRAAIAQELLRLSGLLEGGSILDLVGFRG